jgi:hypothetical protein
MARIAPLLLALLLAGCAGGNVAVAERPSCVLPREVVPIGFSATKYPNVQRHVEAALAAGWPSVLVLHRAGADARRDRALRGVATRPGVDRDEYPPAVARRSGPADVAYVPSAENRSHGATLGTKLRRFCDGTRFRYVFY